VWQRYRDRGVLFVGVNTLGDTPDAAHAFIAQHGLTYPNGTDPGRIAIDYRVRGVPEKYLVTGRGQLVHRFIGPVDEGGLTARLEELLALARLTAATDP